MTKSKLTNRLQFTLETDFCSLKEIVSCKHEAAFPSIITPVCGGLPLFQIIISLCRRRARKQNKIINIKTSKNLKGGKYIFNGLKASKTIKLFVSN
jgi:hypothetical protein